VSAVVVIDLCVTSLLTTSSGTCSRRSIVTNVWRKSCGVNAKPTRHPVRETSLSTASTSSARRSHRLEVDEDVVGVQQHVPAFRVPRIVPDDVHVPLKVPQWRRRPIGWRGKPRLVTADETLGKRDRFFWRLGLAGAATRCPPADKACGTAATGKRRSRSRAAGVVVRGWAAMVR
jgi:hypothetical protein